ncbi:SOS response-associated peptidase [Alteribacillus sp. HJP-4]|uniref:SOS response-associated peptidase n=1 Tax=Alteribacillus sp. HJP-4 TaxID=2775394 RepID=UPI0035CCE7CE
MCGRFTITLSKETLEDVFDVEIPASYEPRYNAAPGQEILCVVNDGENNRAGFLRWGLVPSWADSPKIGYKMINARGETAAEKPAFKRLLSSRRCLVLADSFYEWKAEPQKEKKQPYRISVEDQPVIAFAGLWDRWEQSGEEITSCTIITTQANAFMKELHDRMPVILDEQGQHIWLDRQEKDVHYLSSLLEPYPSENMTAYTVSTIVNSPKNDTKSILEPLET